MKVNGLSDGTITVDNALGERVVTVRRDGLLTTPHNLWGGSAQLTASDLADLGHYLTQLSYLQESS